MKTLWTDFIHPSFWIIALVIFGFSVANADPGIPEIRCLDMMAAGPSYYMCWENPV